MEDTIKLIIADDHEIFRDGIALMLSRQSHIKLVAQAENGRELMQLAATEKPDVILTDIKMPIVDGIEATKQLGQKYPDIKVIALSMFDEEQTILEMLEAGAKGYLLKNADKHEIIEAIVTVHEGNTYYCRHTSVKLAAIIVKSRFNPYNNAKNVSFTDREKEIIKLICEQNTTQEIGEKLFLSKRTVEGYRTKILEKIDAKNTAGIVMYALKNGIIKEEN